MGTEHSRPTINRQVFIAAIALAVFVAACGEPGAGPGSATTRDSTSTTTTSLATTTSSTTTTTLAPAPTVVSGSGLIVVPGSDGQLPPDLEVGCPSGPWFPISALEETVPVEDRPELEAAIAPFLASGEGDFWPQTGWRLLHETADQAILVYIDRVTPQVGFMYLSVEDGTWKWSGSSLGESCPLKVRIPASLNTVDWRLDPAAAQLTPDSTTIRLLATERECVSGQPMGDRLLEPHVIVTADQVLIALAAERPPGDAQTCPGNPEQEVTIDLGMDLGNREVVDGLAVLGLLEELIG